MARSLLVLILILTVSAFFKRTNKEFHISGNAQGTTYHITYVATDSIVGKGKIDSVLVQLDNSLSIYKPNSLISKFNNSQKGVVADTHLRKVVVRSLQIFNDTHGSFDITVYPLVTAWGFGNTKVDTFPDSAMVKALMPCVGSQKLKLIGNRLSKSIPCVKIDVNGIAQGYSADVVAAYLEKKGIKNYLVEIGGELRVNGRKSNSKKFRVGIEGPAQNNFDEPAITKVIELGHGAITTSGSYRKYIESKGIRLSHLINPKTGYPIKTDMVSVTVIAADGITADGYDNPLMAMPVKKALNFVKGRNGMEAYFIYHKPNGALADTATAGFYKLLVNKQE